MKDYAIGIDIGGTGIKGGLVDLAAGELITERFKIPTPDGGEPEAIAAVVVEIIGLITEAKPKHSATAPVGVCFPAVVKHGVTLSAANISKRWIDFEAEKLFESALSRDINFVNDADAAGYAEAVYGAAKGELGSVFMTTLGTGIGTALMYKGLLVPNLEFGHLIIDGVDWETKASGVAREREGLSWEEWGGRLRRYYGELERYFSPDLFIVGGGVSKSHEKFLPYITGLRAPIVPAQLRNNAGIIGSAALAGADVL